MSFIKESRQLITEQELDDLKSKLVTNPLEGDLIPGLRGIRKIRWHSQQKGKRGGVRVIYFFHNMNVPLFLLDIYAKSEQQDLSFKDKKLLNNLIDELLEQYGEHYGQ